MYRSLTTRATSSLPMKLDMLLSRLKFLTRVFNVACVNFARFFIRATLISHFFLGSMTNDINEN